MEYGRTASKSEHRNLIMWQYIATSFLYMGREGLPCIRRSTDSDNRKAILMFVALAIKMTLLAMTAALLAYVYVSYMAPHM